MLGKLWRMMRGVAFELVIEGGDVVAVKGEVSEEYVKDVERICELWGIERGVVKGVGRGEKVRIVVGGGIGKKDAMAFKNAWRNPL